MNSAIPSDLKTLGDATNGRPISIGLRLFHLFQAAVCVLGAAVCIQASCVLASNLHPLLELANHFSLHTAAAGCVAFFALLLIRWPRWAAIVGLATLYLMLVTQPWTLLRWSAYALDSGRQRITVMSWNVLSSNQSLDEVQSLVHEVNPDILVLFEVVPGMLEELPGITRVYPSSIDRPSWGGGGIAVFSRIAGTQLELHDFGVAPQPAVIATLPSDERTPLKLVALHTLSPIPVFRKQIRDQQLQAAREWCVQRDQPICICGDLNTTPWTRSFQELVTAGFIDARRGRGNGASWPSWLGCLGIPIDHVLTKGDCYITDRRILSVSPGSDHRPVVFELGY